MKKARTSKSTARKSHRKGSARPPARRKVVIARPKKSVRKVARPTATTAMKTAVKVRPGSAASLAASVLSRRAATKAENLGKSMSVAPPPRPATQVASRPTGRGARGAHGRPGRSHAGGGLPGSRPLVKMARTQQFNYMKAPGADSGFDVGDVVEVFCDHEDEGERVRGWIKGVVVQVDNKLVAVQFRSNVFLTDGWMVPDRILWYSLGSEQIRSTGVNKKNTRAVIPEY